MGKDLVISSNRHETKVAILEDEQLVEIYFQRANEYSLVGSIHKGRVTRVLPGMQSAFVDIGLERDAFLYVSDFFEESDEYEQLPASESRAKAAAEEPARPAKIAVKSEESDGGRDRRGRRSRRRRNKGRGFPETKYAPPVEEETKPAPEVEPPAEEPPEEIFLLPGESLAKYSQTRSRARGRETGESGPSVAAVESEQETGESSSGDEPAEEASAVESRNQIELEEPEAPQEDEAAESVAEAAEEEQDDVRRTLAETDESGDEEEQNSGDEEEEESGEAEEVELRPHAQGGEDEEGAAEESLSDDESGPEPPRFRLLSHRRFGRRGKGGERRPAESEDSDIQDMILDQLDESVKAELAAEAEQEHAEEDQKRARLRLEGASGAGAADSDEDKPAARSATVREQNARFLQRGSRRGRRRGRGGRDENRATEVPAEKPEAAEPAGPPEAEAAAKSDNKRDVHPEKQPLISDLLKERQEILVQIAKEPLGQKGARITSHIAMPGRYVVYMPTLDHLGVSRKIGSDEERQRLRRILQNNRQGIPGGFIMRTAGEGQSEKDIASDMNFLFNLWMDIRQKAEKRKAPALLHHDLKVVERVLRDQVSDDFNTVWVDQEDAYESVLQFFQRFQPALVNRVRMYTRPEPIFDAFGITQELEKALRPKVWLKSGGYIVINQTEALVAIDINTGKYVGRSNRLEDTIVKTNIEAVKEIVRQIRLRDLGGIIVVDFIDMDERKNRQKVMQALEEAMRADRAPNKILQFNDFGLVAITRKRVKQSLERTLCMPCPYCEGAAYVKSVGTIISEILHEASKRAEAVEGEDVMLRVHPDVAKVLKDSRNEYLQELEEVLGVPVLVTADPLLHHEKFDLA